MTRLIERVVNPAMRALLTAGIAPRCFALLETTGRRTGLTRRTPVGNGYDSQDVFWLVAEHGRRCDYVRNLEANPHARVKVGRSWLEGVATVLPDDDGRARRRRIDSGNGLFGRIDGLVFAASATTPLTIRIDLQQPPAHASDR
jgi:deazaflavin-dependent oxidoreductase (nitroreductase family)